MKQFLTLVAGLCLVSLGLVVGAWAGGESEQKRPPLEIIVESKLGFNETIEAVKKAATAEKYGVQGVHELSKILTEKGFPREPMTIVEVCNPKAATDSLNQDIRTSLMMPCPFTVYQKGDRVYVMTFDTRTMAQMYEGDQMPQVAAEVNASLRKILFAVAKR